MEERIADIPALVPLLERLTALALPVVPMLDPMSVSNIFWALGTLRLSPAGPPRIISARRPPQASPPGCLRRASAHAPASTSFTSSSDLG